MRQLRSVFLELVDAVHTAPDAQAFRALAERVSRKLGFRSFAYVCVGNNAYSLITTYPNEWTDHYLKQEYQLIDPVLIRAQRVDDPFLWDGAQGSKGRGGSCKRLFGEAAEFGIERGVTIPIRAGFDRYAAFTFVADRHGPDFDEKSEEAQEILQLMAMYFHAHVEAAARSSIVSWQSSPLSQREAECEPPRVCRRPQPLRGWGYGQQSIEQEVFP